jgi:hypothetical protein
VISIIGKLAEWHQAAGIFITKFAVESKDDIIGNQYEWQGLSWI